MTNRALALLLCFAVTGCTNTAIFVTKTGTNIVDLDTTPPAVGIGYERVEGFLGPRVENGTLPSVTGWVSQRGGLFDRDIRQVYATGSAAKRLTSPSACEPATPAPSTGIDPCSSFKTGPEPLAGDANNSKLMFAGATASVGVRIGVDASHPSLHFGYRRKEVSMIPLGEKVGTGGGKELTYPSVIAMFSNDTNANPGPKSTFAVTQYFATGEAAENLAADRTLRDYFRQQGRDSITEFKESQREQQRAALNLIECFTKVEDTKLPGVWTDAQANQIVDAAVLAKIQAGKTTHDQRYQYVAVLTDVMRFDQSQDTASYGIRLERHRGSVCKLAA